jgi:hypothetical protein
MGRRVVTENDTSSRREFVSVPRRTVEGVEADGGELEAKRTGPVPGSEA